MSIKAAALRPAPIGAPAFDSAAVRAAFPILAREVNGKPLVGAQPIEAFREAIRDALREAGTR